MNIKQDFSLNPFDGESNPIQDMETSMAYLFDKFIEPIHEELEVSDLIAVGLIGGTLKTIAEKAQAYDSLTNKSEENQHYRN